MDKKSVDTKFDYEGVMARLTVLNADTKRIQLDQLHDLCKTFTKLSGALGSLVAWGFQGKPKT